MLKIVKHGSVQPRHTYCHVIFIEWRNFLLVIFDFDSGDYCNHLYMARICNLPQLKLPDDTHFVKMGNYTDQF